MNGSVRLRAVSLGGVLVIGLFVASPGAAVVLIFADGFETGNTDRWACVNLECYQVSCPSGTTTVSGKVYAPNGTLPLPHVSVYVPNAAVPPFAAGVACERCADALPGNPLVATTTDESGAFVLGDMPVTNDVPLVIQIGRWRRQLAIPVVDNCTDTPLVAAETRLPRTAAEGDIPRIAVSTGSADALECLLRKVGVADSEFSVGGAGGRIHLFAGNGTDQFDPGLGGATFLPSSTSLWDSPEHLAAYDIVVLSCDAGFTSRNQAELDRMVAYADSGGRAFATHWHNDWIQAPSAWSSVATWATPSNPTDTEFDVDLAAGGGDFAAWLFDPEVGASTQLGKLVLQGFTVRQTATGIGAAAERWIYRTTMSTGQPSIQAFTFTTPIAAAPGEACGRVLFSDTHSTGADSSDASLTFPSGGCTSDVSSLIPQEKALVGLLFELSRCVE